MIVIVDHLTPKDEGDCYEDFERYRTKYQRATQVRPTNGGHLRLLMTLQYPRDNQSGFNKKISAQNRWVIAVYKQSNMNALEECMNWLSTAMQMFKVCNIWTNDALRLGD
jgi:hypothetical protein